MNKNHHRQKTTKNNLHRNKRYRKKLGIVLSLLGIFTFSIYISFSLTTQTTQAQDMMVYKNPSCECCEQWIKHLKDAGFNVTTRNRQNIQPIKRLLGIRPQFQACHTATVGNYFVEGHVPAADIKKLLEEKPKIKGLAVPGMPMGSPGMEGYRQDKYNVIALDKNSNAQIYSQH